MRLITTSRLIALALSFVFFTTSLFASFFFLSKFEYVTHTMLEHFVFALALQLAIVLGCFSAFEYSFKYATAKDKNRFKESFFPKKDPTIIGIYEEPQKAKLIGRLGRYLMFLCNFFLVVGFVIIVAMKQLGYKSIGGYAFTPLAFFGVLFFLVFSFLRMLVRCPHCDLDIYFQDTQMYAYYNVAKRALKDNVLECWHCHAAYALDPNMDLEKLREENIKNWQERDEIKKNLEQQQKVNQKFM